MGSGTPAGHRGGFLGVTRLRRSTNASGAVYEGTSGMQRESLMLSRFRPDWKVILVNHFPSLIDGSSCVSTSRPCALYSQKAPSMPCRRPAPHLRQAWFIRIFRMASLLGGFSLGETDWIGGMFGFWLKMCLHSVIKMGGILRFLFRRRNILTHGYVCAIIILRYRNKCCKEMFRYGKND